MKVITARIGEKQFEDLKNIEKEEQTERAEVMRKLLANAIKEWKVRKALELLKEHKVTLRRAAKLADASYAEMLDLASNADIDMGYSLKELRKDLA
ncbi:UPF0175 family protein [Candidatus Woesearchaeota archaeon]|nr:UPF0175 family protein [Candidatus Woesearchaeota archaeon]